MIIACAALDQVALGGFSNMLTRREQEVGIAKFITPGRGFSAIIKHRYSDFQVFEVDTSGAVAHLTSTEVASEQVPEAAAASASAPASSQRAALSAASTAAACEKFKAIAGEQNAGRLGSLLARALLQQERAQLPQGAGDPAGAALSPELQALQAQACPDDYVLMLPETKRETRKAMHEFLKGDPSLPPLATDTVPGEDGTMNVIRVQLDSSGGGSSQAERGGRGQKRQRGGSRGGWKQQQEWPGGRDKQYCRFVLYKENLDTHAAVSTVAKMLHCNNGSFGYAGTKDKRGVTCQFMTLFKIPASRLAGLNQRLRGIKLGCFSYCSEALWLGQLRGNRFKLLLRGISAPEEEVAAACEAIKQQGFINYFGMQRFGTGGVPTHKLGAVLLLGDWQGAVQLLMQGDASEQTEVQEARQRYVEKGDAQAALRALPRHLLAERSVLQALSKPGSGSNYCAALLSIPRTLRMLYLHAWQSYLWNSAATARVEKYGADRVVAGDLVLLGSSSSCSEIAAAAAAEDGGEQGTLAAAAAEADVEEAAASAEGSAAAAGPGDCKASRLAAVHLVTEEEADAGRYSIQDVVLPLPGSMVEYPQHEAGAKLYSQLAAADGVVLEGLPPTTTTAAAAAAAGETAGSSGPSSTSTAATAAAAAKGGGSSSSREGQQHRVKDFSLAHLTGDYRRLLHVPQDLGYSFIRYSSPNQDGLLQTDWQLLQEARQGQHEKQQQGQQQGQATAGAADNAAGAAEEGCGAGAEEELPAAKRQKLAGPDSVHELGQNGVAGAAEGSREAAQAAAAAGAAGPPAAAAAGDGGVGGEGTAAGSEQLLGLHLEFCLPASCYATMLIRELTKESTSKDFQKGLTAAAAATAVPAGAGDAAAAGDASDGGADG